MGALRDAKDEGIRGQEKLLRGTHPTTLIALLMSARHLMVSHRCINSPPWT